MKWREKILSFLARVMRRRGALVGDGARRKESGKKRRRFRILIRPEYTLFGEKPGRRPFYVMADSADEALCIFAKETGLDADVVSSLDTVP